METTSNTAWTCPSCLTPYTDYDMYLSHTCGGFERVGDFLVLNAPKAFDTKDSGKKNDRNKPPMALLSGAALIEVAKVLEFGSHKYDAWNWKGGFKWTRLGSAVLRHVFAWLGGEDKDSETGLSHLAHASCGLMFLLDFEVNKLGTDDRYKGK